MIYYIDAELIKKRKNNTFYLYGEHNIQRSWAGHYDELPGMSEQEISDYIATENEDLFRRLGALPLTYSDVVSNQDHKDPRGVLADTPESTVEESYVVASA